VGRAYGVPVVGGSTDPAEKVSRTPRARPNWWVILAVSLALIALLVATGSAPRPAARHGRQLADSAAGDPVRTTDHDHASSGNVTSRRLAPTTTSSTSTTVAASSGSARPTGPTTPVSSTPGAAATTSPSFPPVTTTTASPTTTTTTTVTTGDEQAADRSQWQGVLDPPGTRSQGFAFTGSGATQVSVVWSGATYLTMVVSCPDAGQSVGGTSAMAATLPDASGACMATVTEPASESVGLTFTITIGPAGA
jgi:cytoskeletal protein RodZ